MNHKKALNISELHTQANSVKATCITLLFFYPIPYFILKIQRHCGPWNTKTDSS